MVLFDSDMMAGLLRELRGSMRRLLVDLCDELETRYPEAVSFLRLPLGYLRFLGQSLPPDGYEGWKVVGWVEDLNDLVYFIDLQAQLRRERDPRGFVRAFWAEGQDQWFENRYWDDLFPEGIPEQKGFAWRLDGLCARLAREILRESLFLVPGLPCVWLSQSQGEDTAILRSFPFDLGANFERAEQDGCLAVGLEGGHVKAPAGLRRALARTAGVARLCVNPDGIQVRIGSPGWPVLSWSNGAPHWHWRSVAPRVVRQALTLGPALLYRRGQPCRVTQAPADSMRRLQAALSVIEQVWPQGGRLLRSLTHRIVPLKARGVVSFSYRHRPGLSFINTYERDELDLVDDLLHENSHHHLNLLLRKHRLRRGDRHREVFYSPWRRSLRPLHGILHATFTFTVGAVLFERISSYAAKHGGRVSIGREAGLGPDEVVRARFRCLEEVESVRYSLEDLSDAAHRLGWLTASGLSLVRALQQKIDRVARQIAPFRNQVLRSKYGPALRRHVKELEQARTDYGRLVRFLESGRPKDLKRRIG